MAPLSFADEFVSASLLDRIPDHAIVNEAVRIAKGRKEGSEKFVNAILRKLLREGLPAVDTIKRKNKRYSVEYSLPVWLVKALIEEYGEERACAIFLRVSISVINPVFV